MGVKLPASSACRSCAGCGRSPAASSGRCSNCPKDAPIILFVGRVSKEKDVDLVSEAVASIGETLVLVGDGPLRSELRDKPHIRSTGLLYREDLDRAFLAADILASASTTDTLGRVFLESLAHGTPILVPDRGQHLSALPEQPPAVWTYEWSPTDATNLAAALRGTLSSLGNGSNADAAAFELARTRDWSQVIDSHLEPYHAFRSAVLRVILRTIARRCDRPRPISAVIALCLLMAGAVRAVGMNAVERGDEAASRRAEDTMTVARRFPVPSARRSPPTRRLWRPNRTTWRLASSSSARSISSASSP